MYTESVSSSMQLFDDYMKRNIQYLDGHPASAVSDFWSDLFKKRKNFPSVSDMLGFMRSSYFDSVGDDFKNYSEEWRVAFEGTIKSTNLFTPPSFIRGLRQPTFGSPICSDAGENGCISNSFAINAGATWRIKSLWEKHGTKKPLHICEVGSGWGECALQIHQSLEVASYTVVDLPEHLCLSSVYLPVTLPERSAHFIDCDINAVFVPQEGTLNFAFPPAIDRIAGPYDLIINAFSFQEMDRQSVDAYFGWALTALAPGGLIISLNSHDKSGITRASQYLHKGLSLIHMSTFRKRPAGWFNTIPYEMVFVHSEEQSPVTIEKGVNVLGELIQLGLDSNLSSFINDVLGGGGRETDEYAANLENFFYSPDENSRKKSLEVLQNKSDDLIVNFIAGNYLFSLGQFEDACTYLERSLQMGLRDFAAVRAQAMIQIVRRREPTDQLIEAAAGLAHELGLVFQKSDVPGLQRQIAHVLDCPYKPHRMFRKLSSLSRGFRKL